MSCQSLICLKIKALVKIKVSENGHLIHLWTLGLFIVQRFSRFNLHGLSGRNADTNGNHQSYQ